MVNVQWSMYSPACPAPVHHTIPRFDRKAEATRDLSLPAGASAAEALDRVLRLPAVCSKRFLTTKVGLREVVLLLRAWASLRAAPAGGMLQALPHHQGELGGSLKHGLVEARFACHDRWQVC